MDNIYHLSAQTTEGDLFNFEQLKGKVVMIVNTASECGFTPQYDSLQHLYDTYKQVGFEILAFPTNDFGSQEPLNGKNLRFFCEENYQVEFPLMDKVSVKGRNKHPVFEYLSSKKLNGYTSFSPIWNFQKYLIDKKGYVRQYFLPVTSPESKRVKKTIEQLLHENI